MATARLSRGDDPRDRETIIRKIVREELDALTERLIQHVREEDNE